jgi:hypothetical protein
LNTAGFNVYQLVNAGHLTEATAEREMWDAATAAGLSHTETAATLASAREAAGRKPRTGVPAPRQEMGRATAHGAPDDQPARPTKTGKKINARRASDFEMAPVLWAWNRLAPIGSLAIFYGEAGIGKSTVTYWALSGITRGTLPGEHHGTPRNVLVCATEDGWADTIVPRLVANGADLDRVFHIEVVFDGDGGATPTALVLPNDLPLLAETAIEHDAAVLLLDPLLSRIESSLDTYKARDVRQALEPIKAMAETAGLSVWGIAHPNKATTSDAKSRLAGSAAFTEVVRSSVIFVPDPDLPNAGYMGSPKHNLTPGGKGTAHYQLVDTLVGTAIVKGTVREIRAARVAWLADDPRGIEEIHSVTADAPGARSLVKEVATWLVDYLTDNGGEATYADLSRAGLAAGYEKVNLRRARERLGRELSVINTRTIPRRTIWRLEPGGVTPSCPVLTEWTDPTALPLKHEPLPGENTPYLTDSKDSWAGVSPLSPSGIRSDDPTLDPTTALGGLPDNIAPGTCPVCKWDVGSLGHEIDCAPACTP